MRVRMAVVTLGLLACATTASADVKMVAQMSGKMMGMNPSGETVTYIKGTKMRTDQTMGGNMLSTIMDVESGELISINHKKKEAEIWNIADMCSVLQGSGVEASGVDVTITPNGQSKEIAGYKAVGHDMSVSVKSSMGGPGGMEMTVNISGPAFLSTDAPGAKDYAAFYTAAAEKGVPLESKQIIKLSGDGPMAGLFARMGGGEINSTVTSVSADPLADDLFTVPAGYKTKRQKLD